MIKYAYNYIKNIFRHLMYKEKNKIEVYVTIKNNIKNKIFYSSTS